MPIRNVYTVGSLTIDLYMRPMRQKVVEEGRNKTLMLPFGEKVRVEAVHELFGGGAANTAIALKRLGIECNVVGAAGDDVWANAIAENLKNEGVGSGLIHRIKSVPTAFSVIINSFSGERTILAYSGANKKFIKLDEKIFNHCEAIHLCHLSGNAKKVFERVKRYFIKYPEKFLSWNPGKEQFELGLDYFRDFLPVVDIMILNKEESEEFTGIKAKSKDKVFKEKGVMDYGKIFKKMYNSGFRGIFVITDGQNGAQVCDGGKIIYCPIYKKFERLDTLGAGDAYSSTFLGAIIKGKDIYEASKMATVNAASCVSKFGAQPGLLGLRQLEKRAKDLKIKEKLLK